MFTPSSVSTPKIEFQTPRKNSQINGHLMSSAQGLPQGYGQMAPVNAQPISTPTLNLIQANTMAQNMPITPSSM